MKGRSKRARVGRKEGEESKRGTKRRREKERGTGKHVNFTRHIIWMGKSKGTKIKER